MSILNKRERELVAIGAALASNCVPCIEYHIHEARIAGLTDEEITEAIICADKIKRVPADKVLDVASNVLSTPLDSSTGAPAPCCPPASGCC